MKRFILTILVLVVLAAIVGVATGFIDMTTSGQLRAPKVAVTAEGGEVPNVDLDTKQLVVGTKETNVGVPKLDIENSTIRVPTVAVRDDGGEPRQ
jgi:hypothetical protein